MTTVEFELAAADPSVVGTPVAVEAKCHPARRGAWFVVPVGGRQRWSAEGDHCVLTALLPCGATVTESIALTGPTVQTVLHLGEYGDRLSLFTTARQRVWGSFADPAYHSAWVRLWRQSPTKKWEVVPWPGPPVGRTDGAVAFQLSLPPMPHMVQTGGYGITPQLTVLPSSPQVRLTVLPAAGRTPWLATFVTTDDLPGEALRGYLACGALSAARMVADSAAGPEESLMGRLARDYLSLRAASPEKVKSLPAQLTSDDAVIQGWRLLTGGRQPDQDRARAAFLQAVDLGTPLFPEGLRLLADGLRRLGDRQTTTALMNLAPLMEAADLAGPTTAFAGTEPDRPAARATSAASDWLPHTQPLAATPSSGTVVVKPELLTSTPSAGVVIVPHAQDLWLRREGHVAQEAVEVLTDVSLWKLTADRWQRLSHVLDSVLSAIRSADVAALQDKIMEVELLGPTRASSVNKSAIAPPADVDRLVGTLIEVISVAVDEQGADRPDGRG
ncbi:hypothetical protein CS0771_57380 [Catellatospora sp. IY07-71]|uniref:CATRA system-associated protein n=1 Tax=Catellatospora sp. IY07-71 TaxID=2728827 RepID=UPI001BB43CB2|nr:CATRA system-associated protein [Catellatospora sp. IY07-71]BCJ76194.1 hypothetical protein CS0771_57380 [Catellatospora sp. IY07-71]